MNIITVRQIEEAGMNAWPAHQQMLYDGWLLRFADGYTKRANSVMPVYESSLDLDVKIDHCEAIYRQQGLPPIFRLTPLAQDDLDLILAGRGYKEHHPTHVLTRSLVDWDGSVFSEIVIRELPLAQWMGVFSEISGSLVEKQPAHAEILRNIINPCLMTAVEKSGKWVACGLGVIERDWFGLFDIVTRPDARRQGLGTQLIAKMLDWAKSQGATKSYLQVMANNIPAMGLYAKEGYADAYRYWYRVPEDWDSR